MDKILERYAAAARQTGGDPLRADPGAVPGEAEIADDLGAFGWLRGVRDRPVMLELRKKTGAIRAISYGWLEKIDYDPNDGITLHVGGEKIRIKGRNLNAPTPAPGPGSAPGGGSGRPMLFGGICRHKVPWIQEADRPRMIGARANDTIIEEICW